ncbi:MAG: GNAT family N-acetyltransferase [Candidatus Asgardarchaeia archaeon]
MEVNFAFEKPTRDELKEIMELRKKMGRLDDERTFERFLEDPHALLRIIKVDGSFAGYYIIKMWKQRYCSIYEINFLNKYFSEQLYIATFYNIFKVAKSMKCKEILLILQYDEKYQFEILSNLGFVITSEIYRYAKHDFALLKAPDEEAILVTPATESDIPKILKIDAMLFSKDEQLTSEIIKDAIAPNNNKSLLLTARSNYEIIGFSWAMLLPRKIGSIVRIAVHPEWHMKAVGTKLINSSIKWFRDNEVRGMVTRVLSSNVSAQRFFEALGFNRVAIEYKLTKKLD